MGFLKKEKNGVKPEKNESMTNMKKNKKDTMASVLRESVLESSLEELRDNKLFVTKRNGETIYVGLMLRVEDIGGLSKKSSKDEAKGSMIESINNGRIKVLITADMMEREEIIIIPDVYTCDAMDEYSILTEAPYSLAFINDAGDIEVTSSVVSFEEIKQLVSTDGDINQFLVLHGIEFAKAEVSIPTEYEDYYTSGDNEPEYDDDIPFEDEAETEDESMDYDDEPDDYDDGADDIDDYEEEDENDDYDDEDVPDIADVTDVDDDYADEDDEETQDEVSSDAFEEAITRKFYSDDLGLTVTTEPFDAQFMHANTYVPFDENRGDGWVNQYLNELSKSANIEMERLHKTNLIKMRDLYYKLIAMHCEQIQKDLDSDNTATSYGQVMSKLNVQRNEQQKNIDIDISNKRKEIEEDWNAKLEQVAKDAASEAKQQYISRFGRQHESDMDKAATVIQAKFEDEYQDGVRQVNDRRRADAAKRLDYGITETLSEISKLYMKCLDEEQDLYRTHAEKIAKFLDENRKEDIAQRELVEKQISESNTAEELMKKYKNNLETMTSEFESRKAALNAEVETAKQEAENLVKQKEAEFNEKIAELKSSMQDKQREFDELLDKYSSLDEKKDREYQSRINELKNERESWVDRCADIEAAGKRHNSIATSLIIVAVVASLAIGALFGLFINVEKIADDMNSNAPGYYMYDGDYSSDSVQADSQAE